MKERCCTSCVHCEMVHGLEQVVLICSHRPGYRGLWVAVSERNPSTGLGTGACARFKLRGDFNRFFDCAMLRSTPHRFAQDDTRLVPLSQGKFALVDQCDYAAVMRYSWYAQKSYEKPATNSPPKTPPAFGHLPFAREELDLKGGGLAAADINTPSPLRGTPPLQGESSYITWYAVRKDGGRTVRMHREIVGAASGEVVDHINHDGLDNRRCNLRVCSHAENVRNQRGQRGRSSRYKGVSRDRRLGKWRAQIWHNGEHTYLGLFESEMAAAEAYNSKARELFGEFAYLNEVG